MKTNTMNQESSTAQDTKKILQLLEESYPANVRSGDSAKYASLYTEDALWMPLGALDRHGTKGINEGTTENFKKFDVDPYTQDR